MANNDLSQWVNKQTENYLKTQMTSLMIKLKSGMDEGPGGSVTLTSAEACIAYRLISKT